MQASPFVRWPDRPDGWRVGLVPGNIGVQGRRRVRLAVVLMEMLLAGCTVGPDYRAPLPAMPAQWHAIGENGVSDEPQAMVRWWELFGDPELDTLVVRAMDANRDLKIAEARVREARALWRAAGAAGWPTVDADGSYTRLRRSENVASSAAREQDLYQAGFDAVWEIDLFGAVRRSVEAAEARVQATEENRRDVLVTLTAEVATNYLVLRGSQRRLAIARENIQIQQATVDLTQGRLAVGLGNRLAVVQSQALLASTEARVPAMEAAIRQAIYRLGVLLGREPGALLDELLPPAAIPPAPPEVPVGMPSDLLRRRPDIRRVERELAAATATIGVATADLFPRFSLGGLFGLQSTAAADLLSSPSGFWTFGPALRWPVFDAGRVRAAIQVETARQEVALAQYEKTLLNALEEVERAMVGYVKGREADTAMARAVETTGQSSEIALELYRKGLVDFFSAAGRHDPSLYRHPQGFHPGPGYRPHLRFHRGGPGYLLRGHGPAPACRGRGHRRRSRGPDVHVLRGCRRPARHRWQCRSGHDGSKAARRA